MRTRTDREPRPSRTRYRAPLHRFGDVSVGDGEVFGLDPRPDESPMEGFGFGDDAGSESAT